MLSAVGLLGLTSFGGPVAHLGYFREEFVGKRRWLTDAEYADVVALCQFLPGPASSQVGMALGWRRAGLPGLLAAFVGFTTPSALVLALAMCLGLTACGGGDTSTDADTTADSSSDTAAANFFISCPQHRGLSFGTTAFMPIKSRPSISPACIAPGLAVQLLLWGEVPKQAKLGIKQSGMAGYGPKFNRRGGR